MNLLGVDIGGTKTAVCVGDEQGAIRAAQRFSSGEQKTVEDYLERLRASCREVLGQAGLEPGRVDAVGISAPGPLDVKRGVLIAPPNNPGWHEVPIVAALRDWIRVPVFMNHDGKAAVLAEWHFGQFRGTRNLVYLTCSTGMGAGIILNGVLVQGATDSAGEVGHHVLDPEGPPCGCGKRGCWESYVGGRNVAERLRERIARDHVRTAILDKAGGHRENITIRELELAAREGDPFAVAEWAVFVDRMAQGIGNIVMILNPDAIVLGTIAIRAGDFLMKPLEAGLAKYAWEWPRKACRLAPSALGDRIGDLSGLAVAIAGRPAAG